MRVYHKRSAQRLPTLFSDQLLLATGERAVMILVILTDVGYAMGTVLGVYSYSYPTLDLSTRLHVPENSICLRLIAMKDFCTRVTLEM